MVYNYVLKNLGDGVYNLEKVDMNDCSIENWRVNENYFSDLSNPTEQELALNGLIYGHSMPPQDVWDNFLRLHSTRSFV